MTDRVWLGMAAALVTVALQAPVAAQRELPWFNETLPSLAWLQPDEGSASGVIVATLFDYTIVATNAHVTEGREVVDVFFPVRRDGEIVEDREWYNENRERLRDEGAFWRARVLYEDAFQDVALVAVRRHWSHEPVAMSDQDQRLLARGGTVCSRLRRGDQVFFFGNAGRVPLWQMGPGHVQEWKPLCEEFVILGSAYPGQSGGPVLDSGGRLIGLVTSRGGRGLRATIAPLGAVWWALEGLSFPLMATITNNTNGQVRIGLRREEGEGIDERVLDAGDCATVVTGQRRRGHVLSVNNTDVVLTGRPVAAGRPAGLSCENVARELGGLGYQVVRDDAGTGTRVEDIQR